MIKGAIPTTLIYKSQCSLILAYMQILANNRYQYAYVTKFTSESLLARNEPYKIDSSNRAYDSPLAVLLSVDFTGVIAIL